MQGTDSQPGISRRALSEIFVHKQRREAGGLQAVAVCVSVVEVYNETFRDLLLAPTKTSSNNTNSNSNSSTSNSNSSSGKIEIRESSQGCVSIHGLTRVAVTSAADVDRVAARGQGNRAVCSTSSNQHSSRSHMVLMIDVEVRERGEAPASASAPAGASTAPTAAAAPLGRLVSSGRLSMVDLAGSERISKSEAVGSALTEAKFINKSLSALIDVMCALSERDRRDKAATDKSSKGGDKGEKQGKEQGQPVVAASHIPFRNSKLTHLLSGSLKPGSKLVFITQVSPEAEHVSESVSTLDFGARAKGLDLGKSKATAARAVSLENAERQAEALGRELERERGEKAALRAENGGLGERLEASARSLLGLEQSAAASRVEVGYAVMCDVVFCCAVI
jgi:kinesin family protein C2/C3